MAARSSVTALGLGAMSAAALALYAPVARAAPPAALVPLVQARSDIALALSKPAAACVVRQDTTAPAFHGCIDWHSAVHGTWALVAYGAMTHDPRYDAVVGEILSPDSLEAERRHLVADPEFEMPYGRSWLLRLAVEHERAHRSGLLLPIADEAAASLLLYYAAEAPVARSKAYDSASWALINLHDYYALRQDTKSLATVRDLIRRTFVDVNDLRCGERDERPEFMATCENWAWAASKVMSRAQFQPWIARFMPPRAIPGPIASPRNAHENGLNFSRSWGLWQIYAATGKPEYAAAYARHVATAYRSEQSWNGAYEVVRHWVPQFGMLAIQPLFAEQPD